MWFKCECVCIVEEAKSSIILEQNKQPSQAVKDKKNKNIGSEIRSAWKEEIKH